ncbi:8533_t:CDS:10 [Diversispora eburnea]|uniref:8533_t:CDS:1 n=1 Tax=Diversispora eburnea TaxID=1213867 RepID=A0A9N8V186_9GLOM|nr:8533_t:CDS:10 [Diversispora eburnea]
MVTVAEPQKVTLNNYVGFDSITNQIEKKLLKRGFQFNVIVVGQTGLGKSTLINTIFAAHLIDSKGRTSSEEPFRQTTEIQTVSHLIEENGIRLRLNIVDTPGYGDQVNNENCWEPIIKYIKDQHSAYLRKELTAMRERYIQDTRIHCCLFFISPTGHALKPIDIVVLKKLSEVVNVVPVIAKSDSLTMEERVAFKHRQMIPFAIVGSEKNVVIDGKSVRGRRNRWGVINVENENHCETHLQDLIETTAQIHYEAFRSKQLMALKESSINRLQKERLEASTQSEGGEKILPEEIERIVKYRVENELKKIQERQEEIQTRINEEIERSRTFIEDSGANSVTTERDIEELVLRIERKYEDKILPDLIEQQRAEYVTNQK